MSVRSLRKSPVYEPGMTDANDVVDVAQSEFQELVCEYAPGICEAKEAVICEDGA